MCSKYPQLLIFNIALASIQADWFFVVVIGSQGFCNYSWAIIAVYIVLYKKISLPPGPRCPGSIFVFIG